mmetsp:Transcript_31753/g.44443  ORF Transcript_31753/g.44443 Transcript_31753/m.44443 type:complete len:284 (-) Transcript_31753:554-1405(-)
MLASSTASRSNARHPFITKRLAFSSFVTSNVLFSDRSRRRPVMSWIPPFLMRNSTFFPTSERAPMVAIAPPSMEDRPSRAFSSSEAVPRCFSASDPHLSRTSLSGWSSRCRTSTPTTPLFFSISPSRGSFSAICLMAVMAARERAWSFGCSSSDRISSSAMPDLMIISEISGLLPISLLVSWAIAPEMSGSLVLASFCSLLLRWRTFAMAGMISCFVSLVANFSFMIWHAVSQVLANVSPPRWFSSELTIGVPENFSATSLLIAGLIPSFFTNLLTKICRPSL